MTVPSCGVAECRSPCHDGSMTGRYCAPRRCYCGGCPDHVPLPPSPAQRQRAYHDLMTRQAARRAAPTEGNLT